MKEVQNLKLKKNEETTIINIKNGQSLNDIEINKNDNKGKHTIIHTVEKYMEKKYVLRYNEISLEIEISEKDQNKWNALNENTIWIELKKEGINIPINTFISLLKSGYVEKFNPLKSYFENLPKWDHQKDYINEFGSYLKLNKEKEREQFDINFKKWLVRTVRCGLERYYFNKQAFILSDDGNGQNIGKTSWCRYLCPSPLKDFFAEDMPNNDKDARILLCKNFIINLDELAVLSKREINQLKAYFSKEQINDRLPYDRKNSIIPRIASFIGSTNMSTFLQDETGSVRWIIFSIKDIDWSYRDNFEINKLWAQVYFLAYEDDTFNETFSQIDIIENEKRNKKYTVMSAERELIMKFLKVPISNTDTNVEFFSATEILLMIKGKSSLHQMTNISVGKALKASGFNRAKKDGIYGYYVEKTDADLSNIFS